MSDADLGIKQTQWEFFREFKVSDVQWFHSNDQNVLQISNHFTIDREEVLTWIKAKEKIRKQKRKSKNYGAQKAYFSRIEQKLLQQF